MPWKTSEAFRNRCVHCNRAKRFYDFLFYPLHGVCYVEKIFFPLQYSHGSDDADDDLLSCSPS